MKNSLKRWSWVFNILEVVYIYIDNIELINIQNEYY